MYGRLDKPDEFMLITDDVKDALMHKDYMAAGSTFPSVLPEYIAELMRKVHYHTERVQNTTTINASAVLIADSKIKLGDAEIPYCFVLATSSISCTDPRNFNEEKGVHYAKEKVAKAAREKLWELEKYILFKKLLNNE